MERLGTSEWKISTGRKRPGGRRFSMNKGLTSHTRMKASRTSARVVSSPCARLVRTSLDLIGGCMGAEPASHIEADARGAVTREGRGDLLRRADGGPPLAAAGAGRRTGRGYGRD